VPFFSSTLTFSFAKRITKETSFMATATTGIRRNKEKINLEAAQLFVETANVDIYINRD